MIRRINHHQRDPQPAGNRQQPLICGEEACFEPDEPLPSFRLNPEATDPEYSGNDMQYGWYQPIESLSQRERPLPDRASITISGFLSCLETDRTLIPSEDSYFVPDPLTGLEQLSTRAQRERLSIPPIIPAMGEEEKKPLTTAVDLWRTELL
ncbi:hypothetical protein FA15DRAFT_661368 [Coprinopsis marcescibilis]|uniref:Uncharacterized protein n=1 Tax=Coprinopsis marcescibilis TaxID=230819 RepID=A0A5C3KC97_COPMA|nr:hypothetical protein FA15DRAFT_661368 [Coprinopsis marcescibilis]